MDTVIVYLDDAEHAASLLAPLLRTSTPTRWVLVACAPRMSRRIGKWLSHSARENWRSKWCDKLFTQISPCIQLHTSTADRIEYVVADCPLPELVAQLELRWGKLCTVDARRPKMEHIEEQPELMLPRKVAPGWQTPGVVGVLGMFMVFSTELTWS